MKKQNNQKTIANSAKNYGNGLHVFYRTMALVVLLVFIVLFLFVLLLKGLS